MADIALFLTGNKLTTGGPTIPHQTEIIRKCTVNSVSVRLDILRVLIDCLIVYFLSQIIIENISFICDGTVETMKGFRLRNVLAKIDIMLALKLAAADLIWIMRVELCTS